MTQNKNHLVWIDLEMTGLNPDQDRILEIATIVTDSHLNILAEGPVIAIYQPEEILQGMDKWNIKHHTQSQLLTRVKESEYDEVKAEAETLNFLSQYVKKGESPICGNSICQDRRFLYRHMKKLEKFFHYRHLDVSTIKILAQRWAPKVFAALKKDSTHSARQDIIDSIEELKFYRENIFREL